MTIMLIAVLRHKSECRDWDHAIMLRLGSPALHDIAGWVGKQRQDSGVQLFYRKQEAGLGQKPRNGPQHYSTVVYDLSKNTGLSGSQQFSLIPIGQSQIVRQKSSETFAPTLQLLANDCDKNGGRTNAIANKGCAYPRKYSSEYVRNNSSRRYSLNNVIKQKKADEAGKNDHSGQATQNLYIKKEVSFISITKTDGDFPKRPWHDPNFHVNQNGVIANSTCNEQTEENAKETASVEAAPNGSLQKQECSTIKNTDKTMAMRTSPEIVSSMKTAPFEKISLESFFGKSPAVSLTKPHSSKLRDSTVEQSIQVSHTTKCCSQQATKLEMPAMTLGKRLTWHIESKPSGIETQQKDRKKILQPAPPNNRPLVRSCRVMTKLEQNNLNEKNNSDTRGSEEQKVTFHTFRQRLRQKFENTSPDINGKMKVAFPNTSLSSKIKHESSSLNKRNTFSTAVPESGDCIHPTPRKSVSEQFAFNPMHTAQLSRFAYENCQNDKNNGFLSLNSKNLTLFEMFTSKGSSKLDSKNKRIYKWLEDCRRHAREKLFRDLEAKMKKC